uniref:3-ketoacyl-CoA reductase n=1 Tax=Leptobrachium leishanense TaxID=445787 RepID=A0A8C5W876_9ANUR
MELVADVKTALLPIYVEILKRYRCHKENLALFGALYASHKILCFIHGCYKLMKFHLTICLFSKSTLKRRYGEWAVVTGATNGIGKAYAEELASFGINIILISRNREKLQMVSESINKTYGVKTSFIEVDFNKGREVFPAIREALKNVDVGILVNNAGVCYEYPMYETEVPEDRIWEIINVNVAATTMMVHLVLPGMLERKKGAIINVASVAARVIFPQFTIYAASKTYLDNLTEALHHEYASKGIFIQSLTPCFVATNMISPMCSFLQRKSIFVTLAKETAYQAVRTIGLTRRTSGSYSHSIQIYLATTLPEWLWLSAWNMACTAMSRDRSSKMK